MGNRRGAERRRVRGQVMPATVAAAASTAAVPMLAEDGDGDGGAAAGGPLGGPGPALPGGGVEARRPTAPRLRQRLVRRQDGPDQPQCVGCGRWRLCSRQF